MTTLQLSGSSARRALGACALTAWLLCRQPSYERGALLGPRRYRVLRARAGWPDVDVTDEWTAREIHRADMRSSECRLVCIGSHSDHQIAVHDATEHLPIEKERDTTEHPLLDSVGSPRKHLANPGYKLLVVRHSRFSSRAIRSRIWRASCALRAARSARCNDARASSTRPRSSNSTPRTRCAYG